MSGKCSGLEARVRAEWVCRLHIVLCTFIQFDLEMYCWMLTGNVNFLWPSRKFIHIFFCFYLSLASPFCCGIWWWRSIVCCEKNVRYLVVGSCRCNKSTVAQLFCCKASLRTYFQQQWPKGSVSTAGSWTTYNLGQTGIMIIMRD